MAELQHCFQQQEVEGRMGVDVDIVPETAPVILLGDEDVPVAVVFDELRGAQPKPGYSCRERDENQNETESAARPGRRKLPLRTFVQEDSLYCGSADRV